MSSLEREFTQEENMNPERATSIAWAVRQLGWEEGDLGSALDATDAFFENEADDVSELIKGVARIREKAIVAGLGEIVFQTLLTGQGAEGLHQIGVMERKDLDPMVRDVRRREYTINLKHFTNKVGAEDYLDHYVRKYFKSEDFERWKGAYKKQIIPFMVSIFEHVDPGEYAKLEGLVGRKKFLEEAVKYIEKTFVEEKTTSRQQAIVLLVKEFLLELIEGLVLDMKEFMMLEIDSENRFLRDDMKDKGLLPRSEEEDALDEECGDDEDYFETDDDGDGGADDEWGLPELEDWKD